MEEETSGTKVKKNKKNTLSLPTYAKQECKIMQVTDGQLLSSATKDAAQQDKYPNMVSLRIQLCIRKLQYSALKNLPFVNKEKEN